MIGIRNADGAMTWLLKATPGSRRDVTLCLVRHGQKKVRVQFFLRDNQEKERKIGVLQFPTNFEGFLERPEMEANLRLDGQGRLHVVVDMQGRLIQKRFAIPGVKAHTGDMVPAPVRGEAARPAGKPAAAPGGRTMAEAAEEQTRLRLDVPAGPKVPLTPKVSRTPGVPRSSRASGTAGMSLPLVPVLLFAAGTAAFVAAALLYFLR